MAFPEKLKILRAQQNLTQKAFVEKIGTSQSSIIGKKDNASHLLKLLQKLLII